MVRRVRQKEVTWIEVDSVAQLAEELRRERPVVRGAYGVLLRVSPRSLRYVFGAGAFRALWAQAAEAGFSPEQVGRIFLAADPALEVPSGTRPPRPAYEPDTGAVWVLEDTRSRERTRPRDGGGEDLLLTRSEHLHYESFGLGDAAPVSPAAPGRGELLRRTPHIDVLAEGEIVPGAAFQIDVFCDQCPAAPGEEAEDVTVELPPGEDAVTLQTWLAPSSHFEGEALVGEITVTREPESSRARFVLALAADPPPGPGRITALFHHEGRPCGKVTRELALGSLAAAPQGGPGPEDGPPPRGPRLAVRERARRANLTVEVTATDSEREFFCRVVTDLIPGYDAAEPQKWVLPSRAPDLVDGFMRSFQQEGISDRDRISRLRGAGVELWKAAPENLKTVFWELLKAEAGLRSILIASDEPTYPWELLVPTRGAGAQREARGPLGVEFEVGRWVTEDMIAPPQRVDLVDSYVLAPAYTEEEGELPRAAAEAAYVRANLNGEAIEPGEFDQLEDKFAAAGVALAHFACHGEVVAGSQLLHLEGGGELHSHQVAEMKALAAAMTERQPFVFLNACEAGRTQPALIGTGGFATAFIEVGASCVLAPLWSVTDEVAHELALAFYDELRADPGKTPAAVLKGLRQKAYADDGADSWAAYCFYGDPLTEIAIPELTYEAEEAA